MDAANRRPQLPALSYLDVDKVKREEDSYQTRNIGGAAPSPYPSGPPPPYSHPPPTSHLANSWSSVQSGVRTPPESRRTSGEQEDAKQATRQSLPSISEALGVDSQTSYSAPTPAPPSASAHQSHQTPVAPSSPKRSYGMEPPPVPHSSYTSNGGYSDYPQYRETPRPHSYAPQEPSRAAYAPERPPLHLQTSQAPPQSHSQPSTYSYPTSTSPGYDHPSNSSAGSMPPPSVPYGYQPYPPRYAQPTPPSSVNGGPIYQPSANYPAPSTPNSSWKTESSRYGEPRSITSADYSSSVKRHLDMFDLEGALNDISQSSGIMVDFSRRYGDRMHQTARTGPSLATLPGIVEIDDMISKSRVQMDSLIKIREVVLAQQAAYEASMAEPAKPYETPDSQIEDMEAKGGFASGEPKKRRGRAAPPGRCHSCNRAETPEWRRGPDGARTLCNACGLHYAKLTRKQQGANKTSTSGSSTLRPKES